MPQVDYQSLLASRFATLGQACYGCDVLKSPTNTLSKCAACKRVSYCGAGCQKADWSKHKPFCKAFRYALSSSSTIDIMLEMRPEALATGMRDSLISLVLQGLSRHILSHIQQSMGRPVSSAERDLVMHEPRCLGCGRSESVMRIQAENSNPINTGAIPPSLQQCQDCSFSFSCSKAHWDLARHKHQEVPCATALNGLSQCATNKIVYENFKLMHARHKLGDYCWVPKRIKPQWTSLKGVGWNDFENDFRQDHTSEDERPREIKFRAATEALAMPMTILWALEIFNVNDWTKKETLNIHLIGALGKELNNIDVFEEILHRLPEVRTLKLELINPELALLNSRFRRTQTLDMKTCSDCTKRGSKWIRIISSDDYETYVRKQKPFKNPDLAIAFDTGATANADDTSPTYDEENFPWIKLMKFLVSRKIPCMFTTYDEQTATIEGDMLKKAGLDLHPLLGPRKNPWGSLLLRLEPCNISDFYSHNGWLSGGSSQRLPNRSDISL